MKARHELNPHCLKMTTTNGCLLREGEDVYPNPELEAKQAAILQSEHLGGPSSNMDSSPNLKPKQ